MLFRNTYGFDDMIKELDSLLGNPTDYFQAGLAILLSNYPKEVQKEYLADRTERQEAESMVQEIKDILTEYQKKYYKNQEEKARAVRKASWNKRYQEAQKILKDLEEEGKNYK